ncbi:hypothetical protein JNJ66_01430 [Candidatus Saccharibacteria bacterium]|nr:hypothetical protein [Candidatus Saccharibacteria bacterium]
MEFQQDQKNLSSLWWYIPLWGFFVYMFISILSFGPQGTDNIAVNVMQTIDFGIHETSHLAVGFFPPIIVALAGSMGEIMVGGLMTFAGFHSKNRFAGIFGMLWLMLACHSVGTYIADARAQQLQLVGPGADPKHDWHFILEQWNMLPADTAIGASVRGLGSLIGLAGLLLGLWIIIQMVRRAFAATASEEEAAANAALDPKKDINPYIYQPQSQRKQLPGLFDYADKAEQQPVDAAHGERK